MNLEQISSALGELNTEDMAELSRRLVGNIRREEFPPTSIADVFITQACNLNCDYCFAGDLPPRHANEVQLQRTVDFVFEGSRHLDRVTLVLFGGEPLLRTDLMRATATYARERGRVLGKQVGFEVTTNGTLIDEEAMRLSHEFGFRYLVSVDGGRECHDRHRRHRDGSGSFDEIVAKVPLISAWDGVGPAARITVNPDTVGELAAGIRELAELGFEHFLFGPNDEDPWTDDQLKEYGDQFREVARFCIERAKRGRRLRMPIFDEDLDARSKKNGESWGCHAGRGRLAIDCEGRIFPCARFAGMDDGRGACQLGTLDDGITEWDTRRLVANADPQTRHYCSSCACQQYCAGGCLATNLKNTGSIYRPSEVYCAVSKALFQILSEMPEVVAAASGPTRRSDQHHDPCGDQPPARGQARHVRAIQ